MSKMLRSKRAKRKFGNSVVVLEPPSKVTFLSPSLILLEIPADTNTSFPVWDAVRSQQVDFSWTVNPYSVGIHVTPVTSHRVSLASTQTESISCVTQTAAPSSQILQPQMVDQPITPQQGTTHNSCVLLTLSPNSIPLLASPPPANSLIVSLPLIITQLQPDHQPCTPTKKPTIQTPTTTPTKLPAPSGGPAPSPFHTKILDHIEICDRFLLSLCHAGKKCKMHHTPYPFYWQLWCVTTHQWVNVPAHSQVLLERSYCNVKLDSICLKDGPLSYSLVFDRMELKNSAKYDRVRRLTNSDSLRKNPHFPCQWKIYWWNGMAWEEYNKDVSTLLLKKMSVKEQQCSFFVGSQEYEVDFTTMTQTSVTTRFPRQVRCRPFYRSPDSMRPHLQTGILTEPVTNPPHYNVDPLEEISSWYPPVWCLDSGQDYSLVDLPASTRAYRSVKSLFCESLPETRVDIIGIQQVQNLLHWDKYQRQKAYMQKQHVKSKEPLERHLFHGTIREAAEDICHNNFDPRMAGLNGTSYGYGSYFATTAAFSNTFATVFSNTYNTKSSQDKVHHMFLAKVLVGKASPGKPYYHRPPPLKSKTSQFRLYDSCVDNTDKPTMFVVFDSCQCYPYYLIKYKDLPDRIEI